MKLYLLTLFLAVSLIATPCFAQEIPDAEFIAKGDAARYDAIAFKDNVVAWIEYEQDENNMLASSIHKYNISTGMQEIVIADPSGKFSLDFSGDSYVWSDNRAVYLYDESDGKITFLYTKNPQHSPVIDGDIIVWVEDIDEKRSTLKMYDIKTGEYSALRRNTFYDSYSHPAISNGKIVYIWEDIIENKRELRLYDNTQKNTLEFSVDVPDVHYSPVIDKDTIVWTGMHEGYYTTFMYDINTKESRPVDFTESAQLCPDVSGDNIVWLDFGPYPSNLPWGGNVYLHNTKTGTTEKISKDHKQDYPKVSGDYVVWLDNWGKGHDIYLYNFLNKGRDFLSHGNADDNSSAPTPLPTPETKVRFYSTILNGETDWYSLTPSGSSQLSFELRWDNNDTELSMSVVSPSGTFWHFSDMDDEKDDSAVRMTILKAESNFMDNGKWTIAVSGADVKSETDYDICWY